MPRGIPSLIENQKLEIIKRVTDKERLISLIKSRIKDDFAAKRKIAWFILHNIFSCKTSILFKLSTRSPFWNFLF